MTGMMIWYCGVSQPWNAEGSPVSANQSKDAPTALGFSDVAPPKWRGLPNLRHDPLLYSDADHLGWLYCTIHLLFISYLKSPRLYQEIHRHNIYVWIGELLRITESGITVSDIKQNMSTIKIPKVHIPEFMLEIRKTWYFALVSVGTREIRGRISGSSLIPHLLHAPKGIPKTVDRVILWGEIRANIHKACLRTWNTEHYSLNTIPVFTISEFLNIPLSNYPLRSQWVSKTNEL